MTGVHVATPLTEELILDLVNNRDQMVTVDLSDGPYQMAKKWLLFNLVLWKPLTSRGLGVTKDHVFINEPLTDKAIQKIQDLIFRQIFFGIHGGIDPDYKIRGALDHDFAGGRNEVYNIVARYLCAHQVTMSAFDIAETMLHPRVVEASKLDIDAEMMISIQAVERKIQQIYKQVLDTCMDPELENNVFYPFLKLDIVSQQQLVQNICAAGTRTDVNDQLVKAPIRSSYFRGLQSITEMVEDGLAGRKSAFYNAFGMPQAQYPNRLQQILASTIQHLYQGDCGTPHTVAFYVHAENYKYIVGKFYKVGGEIREVTKDNCHELINQVIHLRSSLVCRHTDGVCQMCVGRMAWYMHPKLVPGFAAVIALMEVVGQLILSNKHLSRTSSIPYVLPPELKPFMYVMRNDVFFDKNTDVKTISLVLPYTSVQINDLPHIRPDMAINDQYFSKIPKMGVADTHTRQLLAEGDTASLTKEMPYLTSEMLRYIRFNSDKITVVNNVVYIDMSGFDASQPFMRCIVSNDSMVRFANNVERWFGSVIARETSCSGTLQMFSDLVYRKIGTNLAHLEICLRASMITDSVDYRLPVVEDPDNVRFGALGHIIPRRGIGPQLAYERLGSHLLDPRTFMVPKPSNIMDVCVGFTD